MLDYNIRRTRQRQKRNALTIIFVVGLLAFSFLAFRNQTSQRVISPLSDTPQPKSGETLTFFFDKPVKKKNPEDLRNIITATVADQSDNYSVIVKGLRSDFTLAIDDAIIYTAASVNKIPILAALYAKIEDGTIDPDRIITMQARDIQDYGTGSMRYDPPGTTYSIQTMARLMIKQSDNTAAYIIASHIIGLKKVQALVTGWGMTQTDMVENTTSNRDMALLFENIYSGKLVNPARTQEMLALMKESDFEDRLPGLLPEGTTVYHKIGTEVGIVHDVGIVETPSATYYIGVMIGDTRDEERSAELIAKISKAVYDFMQ